MSKGNQNALKHDGFTREVLQRRAKLSQLLREARQLLKPVRLKLGRQAGDTDVADAIC